MTPQDAQMIASTAKHTPAQLAEGDMADKVRVLARQWEFLADSVRAADIARIDGRLVITLQPDVGFEDLFELEVL